MLGIESIARHRSNFGRHCAKPPVLQHQTVTSTRLKTGSCLLLHLSTSTSWATRCHGTGLCCLVGDLVFLVYIIDRVHREQGTLKQQPLFVYAER